MAIGIIAQIKRIFLMILADLSESLKYVSV